MFFEILATVSAGLFAGASIYINLVEHPARLECGSRVALVQFGPSYRRATVMQVSLATVGFLAAVTAWLINGSQWWLIGGITLIAVIPFTLLVIFPTNKKLLSPSLETDSPLASMLLFRWGRLHAVRSVLSFVAFVLFIVLLS